MQLGVVCERLVRNGVLSNECSKRFCGQNEQNGSRKQSWLWKFVIGGSSLHFIGKVGWTSWEVYQKFHRGAQVFIHGHTQALYFLNIEYSYLLIIYTLLNLQTVFFFFFFHIISSFNILKILRLLMQAGFSINKCPELETEKVSLKLWLEGKQSLSMLHRKGKAVPERRPNERKGLETFHIC